MSQFLKGTILECNVTNQKDRVGYRPDFRIDVYR